MAYTGLTAPLPVGLQGFTGTRNPSQMGPGHLAYVDGLDYDGGILRKEGGALKLNSASLAQVIVSGINWSPNASDEYDVVFLANGTVKRDAGAGTFPTSLITGLNNTRDPPPWFVAAGGEGIGDPRTLYLFSATNQVHFVDGTGAVMAPIATPPADWASSFPTFGIQHGGRMWAGGNASDPHRIYYSTIADHADYAGAGSGTLAIFPGEGHMLVGAVSFRGLLIIFKHPFGVYVVDTTDPTPANWRVQKLSGAVGAVNQHSIVPIENDVLYLDSGGNIHMLTATSAHGDMQTSNLSQIADLGSFIRSYVNITAIDRVVGTWYPIKRQAWFSVPLLGGSDNNLRIIIDFSNQKLGPRFLLSRRDVAISMWIRQDNFGIYRPATGDATGFVWLMDQEARNKDGVGYQILMETANTDLSFLDQKLTTVMKAGQFLELVCEPKGTWDLTVQVFWDDVLHDTILFSMSGGGGILGIGQLGTMTLGSQVVHSDRKRLVGSGRRIKLIIFNNGVDQDVALAEFLISFKPMDERIAE